MTGSPSRRRLTTIVAASLWLVLAFLVWNVCFDYGVRMAQFRFLGARSAYLRGKGPRVEMADAMAQGIGQSAWSATLACAPCAAVGIVVALAGSQRRT
jgi:ABC-type nitrate/sulfonate/bicarbonate transport system permease component